MTAKLEPEGSVEKIYVGSSAAPHIPTRDTSSANVYPGVCLKYLTRRSQKNYTSAGEGAGPKKLFDTDSVARLNLKDHSKAIMIGYTTGITPSQTFVNTCPTTAKRFERG